MLIYLDPGHGGNNPGCSYPPLFEKDYTLAFAKKLGDFLSSNGHEVSFSRVADDNPPFSQRGWRADGLKADIALVLHVNANPDPKCQGMRCYVMQPGTPAHAFATRILTNAPDALKRLGASGRRQVRPPEIATPDGYGDDVVIRRYLKTPAVLVELGFASNPDDKAYLLSDAGQAEIITNIGEALRG